MVLIIPVFALLAAVSSCSMDFMSNQTTLMPHGALREDNATHANLIVSKLYPDVDQAGSSFSFQYGGVYMAGYFSLLGGASQIRKAIDDCKGVNGFADGAACAISGAEAIVAHGMTAFVGGTYGDGQMAYIASVARQATGINPNNNQGVPQKRALLLEQRQSCPTAHPIITNSYWPDGNEGLKVSLEGTCVDVTQDQVNKCATLAMQLPDAMANASAWQVQATFYTGTDPNNVLARMAFYILGQAPDSCPDLITGSGCHFSP